MRDGVGATDAVRDTAASRGRRSVLGVVTAIVAVVLVCVASPLAAPNAAALRQPGQQSPGQQFAEQSADESPESDLLVTDQSYFIGADGHWHIELDLQNTELPGGAFTPPTTAPPATIPPVTAPPATIPPVTAPPATTPSGTAPTTPSPSKATVPVPGSPASTPGSVPVPTAPPYRPVLVTISVYPAIASVEALDSISSQGSVGPAGPIDSISVPFDQVATPTDYGARIVIDVGDAAGATANTRPFQFEETGVFPVRIAVGKDRTVFGSTNTFIERATESGPTDQIAVSIVANVTDFGPLPSPEQVADATSQIEQIVEVASSTDHHITAIIPPSVFGAIEANNRQLFARLQRALDGSTIVAGPAYALDPDVAQRAGLQANLEASWTDGRAETDRVFPNSTVDASIALVDKPVSPAGIALLNEIGVQFGVAPYSIYSQAAGNIGTTGDVGTDTDPTLLVAARSGQSGSLPVALADPHMSLLDPAEASPATPVARAARVLAYAGLRWRSQAAHRMLLLTTPDIGVPDPDTVVAIDRLADGDPHIAWEPLPSALATTDANTVRGTPLIIAWEQQTSIDITARAEKVNAAGLIVGDAISMLPEKDPRRGTWPSELKVALSTAIDDDQADQIIAVSADRSASVRGALPPPEPFPFTLTGSNTTLRFQLTNNFDTPLDVVVVMSSDRLLVPQRTPVVLQPNAVNNVPIEITARSNGITKMSMYLETPAGNPLFAPVEMTGRVNTYRGVGQLVSVGALLVLATWWLTHLRRRPRSSVAAAASAPSDDDNGTGAQ